MKTILVSFLLAALAASLSSLAAPPAGAPAGSSGLCKDGTYDASMKKSGACGGHKGVKEWWGNAPAATADAGKPGVSKAGVATVAAGKPANSGPTKPETKQPTNPAPTAVKPVDTEGVSSAAASGGADKVWVNEDSKVYHCPGGRWYGKTKNGKYMTEAEAKAAGSKPDHGKPCK